MAAGGRSGSSGFRYQTRYAVWKMIEAASLGLELKGLALFSVTEQGTCFVDDIIVNKDDTHLQGLGSVEVTRAQEDEPSLWREGVVEGVEGTSRARLRVAARPRVG